MRSKYLLKNVRVKAGRAYKHLSYKRKARLYCVGAAKTGTHSIASMFDRTIRSDHEADGEEIIRRILEVSEGKISDLDLSTYIRERDKNLCLDVDSSQLNFYLLDYLLKEFHDALFLLTIRDCYSWLDSFINDSLRRDTSKSWIKLRNYRFQADTFSYPSEEYPLKQRGLYTLNGYLSYWAHHNSKVLATVPEDRLMIIKTNEITNKADDIARFAGLSMGSVQANYTHSFKNPEKFYVLREIEEAHLDAKVQEICGPIMRKFFPEIRSIRDSKIFI